MSIKTLISFVGAVLVVGLLCSPALGQSGSPGINGLYRIRGEANIVSLRMNNLGWRVGYVSDVDADTAFAVLWTNTGWRVLPPLGGMFNVAGDVNDAGLIVGQTDTTVVDRGGRFVRKAFTWRNEKMISIDERSKFLDSAAVGVNRNGWVAGWTADEFGYRHASLWILGAATDAAPPVIDLGTLGGQNSEASAINRHGLVVGFAETEIAVPGAPHSVAFRYEFSMEGRMTALPELVPGGGAAALDVNDFGRIVGWAADPAGVRHAVLWIDGGVKDLGGFGGPGATAYAINNAGVAVGMATVPLPKLPPAGCFAPVERAFMWTDGVMTDLNKLIPADSGWLLLQAGDINDRGEITGIGWRDGELWSFVLTPPRAPLPNSPEDAVKAIGIIGGGVK